MPFALVFASDPSHFYAYTSLSNNLKISLIRGSDGAERYQYYTTPAVDLTVILA